MKLLIFFVVGLTVCRAAENIEEKCVKDLKLDGDVIEKISRESNTPEDNENAKFYLCAWKGRGIMDEKDAFIKEKIEDLLNEVYFYPYLAEERKQDIIKKIEQLCIPIHEAKSERTAMKFKNCMIGIIDESKILPAPEID